jgi:small GTP-binding protein
MEARKICLLGDFAVGKTSLVQRFVHNQFSPRYLSTIGVKVDTKELTLGDGRGLKLAIWDLAGAETPTELMVRYTRGAAGCLLVADATRAETLGGCLRLRDAVTGALGPLPYVVLVNKGDLTESRETDSGEARSLLPDALDWIDTSALTGAGVERAFGLLAERMLAADRGLRP